MDKSRLWETLDKTRNFIEDGCPSFHQLINWDIGLASFVGHTTGTLPQPLLDECREFLENRANQDVSYGTVAPYTFPDLDDTAIALLGMSRTQGNECSNRPICSQTRQLLMKLQNQDGSWGTFPEVTGNPPACASHNPVHIKNVDVTVHVLQALLSSGTALNAPEVQKALWWLAYQQRGDGSWKSTWYLGNAYATSQASELLAEFGFYLRPAKEPTTGWPPANTATGAGRAAQPGNAVWLLRLF